MMMQENNWRILALAGLSLINFTEQNLDGKETALFLEGWVMWLMSNKPDANHGEIMDCMNVYTNMLAKTGGEAFTSWKRCIEVFKEHAK